MINNLTTSLFRGFLLVASLAANLSSAETSEDMLRLMLRSQLGAMGKDFVFVVPKETSDINANETAQLNCFLKLSSFSRCKHGSFRHARQRKRSVLLFDFGKLCQRGTKKCAIKELQRQWRRRKRSPATPSWKIISSPPFLRARGIYLDHLYLCILIGGWFFWKKTCVSFQSEEFLFRASLTVKECPLLVEAGVYHRQNAFLYVDYHGTGDNIARVVFSDKEVRRHRQGKISGNPSLKQLLQLCTKKFLHDFSLC